MRRRRLIILIASVAIVVVFLVLHVSGVTGIGARMEFQSLGLGYSSGITDLRYCVIQDGEEWQKSGANTHTIWDRPNLLPRFQL
jgi:hypothetical protein